MSVFEQACLLNNQSWADSLPTEFEEVVFSKKHQRIMKNLIDKMRGNKYHRFTRRAAAALVAAAIFVSMTVTAFAIPATREFIVERFFNYSTYSVVGGEYSEVGDIQIGYIPAGFELDYTYKDENDVAFSYKSNNDNSWFTIRVIPTDQFIDFDTECDDYIEINYNEYKLLKYQNENMEGYIWNNGIFVYSIIGDIPFDEVIRIIESIK